MQQATCRPCKLQVCNLSVASRASCNMSMHATIHFATIHYMKNETCLTYTIAMCLATKVALPITILGLDHHLGQFHL